MKKNNKKEIMMISEESLKNKIYFIRGQQVILDSDLAKIYGYTTKAFNQQIQRNIDRFDEDFMFRLTLEESNSFVRSQFVTSRDNYFKGQDGGTRYLPYAFTEQGIYMLMTVLKGELAVKQSKALIRLFKAMKDFVINERNIFSHNSLLQLQIQTDKNTDSIKRIEKEMANRNELSNFIKLFDSNINNDEILILDGQPFKADITYQDIYKKAKKNIIIIDNYISIKTLHHLSNVKDKVGITIITDNKAKNKLRLQEYSDYLIEYPNRSIRFIESNKRVHDRYIVLDYNTKNMYIYHCGTSSKDAGKSITTISQLKDINEYKTLISSLLMNDRLILL